MNKLVCTLVTASALVSGSAFGQGKTKPATDKQSKQALRDSQMDGVTAGSVGGSIAGNNSTVTTSDTGAVSLSGSALSGASAINIVNSTNSSVANGVNVYDSSLTTQGANGGSTVNQGNAIDQTTGTKATLDGYHRGANTQLTVNKSSNVTKNSSDSSSINASLNHSASDSTSSTNDSSKSNSSSSSFTSNKDNMQQSSASKNASATESASSANNASKSSSTSDASASNKALQTSSSKERVFSGEPSGEQREEPKRVDRLKLLECRLG
jgi:hypothetical protein